jgi:two-component system nitrogen regulation sensor histidine kinase GlnL
VSESLERLQAVLDSMRVGVVAVDPQGRVELQNAEASRILEISARATRGAALEKALGLRHPAVSLLRQGLEQEREVCSHACSIPRRIGGDPLTVDLTASPITTSRRAEGAVLTLRDRTIGREIEALVAQRVRSELFERLASGIAHEVRNPLGGIRGAAELLLGKLDDAALRRYAELIRDETDRVRRLLDDLSQLTEGGVLAPRPINLHRMLDDLLQLQRQGPEWHAIEVVREYDPSIPEVEVDPDRLAQVFLNLMRNAAQAMSGKGELLVRTRFRSAVRIANEEEPGAGIVAIDFEDTGPGIAEEDLPHVFTPFFSKRAQGTGLGLAIAQHWVVRHGGSIQVTSHDREGTRVQVLLPGRRNV